MQSVVQLLTGVADVIRYKEGTTDLIPALDFADRIAALPTGTGDTAVGQLVRKDRFLTEQEQLEMRLKPLLGQSVSDTDSLRYLFFDQLANTVISGLPRAAFDIFMVIKNRIYIGTSVNSTSVLVVDTTDNTVSAVTGLPNRPHNRFFVDVDNDRIILGSTTTASNVAVINTTDNTVSTVGGIGNRAHLQFAHSNNKLFVGTGTGVTMIGVIDLSDLSTRQITGLPSISSTLFASNDKIILGNNGLGSALTIIDAADETFTTITLPGSSPRFPLCEIGENVYMGNNTGTSTQLTVLNMLDYTHNMVTDLPTRQNNVGVSVNNKAYIMSDTVSGFIIVVDGITNGFSLIDLPNSRSQSVLAVLNTDLYLGSLSENSNIIKIDTTTDTLELIDVPRGTYTSSAQDYDNNKMFLGASQTSRSIVVVNLDDYTHKEITGLPQGTYSALSFQNGRCYVGNSNSSDSIIVLGSDSFLPYYPRIPLYIKY